jgi:N-acetylneuraminic acid mutarotase
MKKIFLLFSLVLLASCSTSLITEKAELKPLADMSYKCYGFGSTTDGKNIYVVGGSNNTTAYVSGSMDKYNIAENKWSILSDSLTPRRYCNAEYIGSENKIYIFNGEYISSNVRGFVRSLEIYDLNTNQISAGPDNPYPVISAGSAAWHNKIYFFGGENSYGFSNSFYEYDPVKSLWKRLPDMPKAKQTSGVIIEGILYVLGGYDGRYMQTGIDAYNIKDSTWTHLGDLPIKTSAHCTASDGRRIWLVGSYNDLNSLAYYDTKTKEFKRFDSNMIGRRHAGTQIIDGTLYVFGGNQYSSGSSAISSTESLDISLIK